MTTIKNPKIWGPTYWTFLYMHAATATTYDKRLEVKKILESFKKHLPCEICQKNLTEHMKKFDINKYLTSIEAIFTYIYLLEINVEISKGKRAEFDKNVLNEKLIQYDIISKKINRDEKNKEYDIISKQINSNEKNKEKPKIIFI